MKFKLVLHDTLIRKITQLNEGKLFQLILIGICPFMNIQLINEDNSEYIFVQKIVSRASRKSIFILIFLNIHCAYNILMNVNLHFIILNSF